MQISVLDAIQFSSTKEVARFDFRGPQSVPNRDPEDRTSGMIHSALQLTIRCTWLPYQNSLLVSEEEKSRFGKCLPFKTAGITWVYQVRSSYSSQNIRVLIILVKVVTERIYFGFNNSQSSRTYSKQPKRFVDNGWFNRWKTLTVPQSDVRHDQEHYSDGHQKRL